MTRLALPIAFAAAAASVGSGKHLAEVRGLISEKGPQAALSALFSDEASWDRLLDAIATGRKEWLLVATDLRRVSDAHSSETLDMAIQEALPKEPRSVLELLVAGTFTVEDACGMYGFGQIEDERSLPALLKLVDKRIIAVSGVKDSHLAKVRDGCLKELRSLRSSLEKGRAG